MNVLVTGGRGYIGSALIRRLLDGGHRVTVLDDGSSALPTATPTVDRPRPQRTRPDPAAPFRLRPAAAVTWVEADVTDPGIGRFFFDARPRAVIHLAAQASVEASVREPVRGAAVNVCGTANVLEHSRACGVRRFVFASTGGAMYGDVRGRYATESAPCAPASPYGASKAAAEAYVGAMAPLGGMRFTVLRLANVYGALPDGAAGAGVVHEFAHAMLRGERPVIYGDGFVERDYVHLDDAVEAHMRALAMTGDGVYNIASGAARTVRAVFAAVAAAAGYHGEPAFEPARPGELRLSRLDPTLARRELGWRARVAFPQGVARTVEAMRARERAPAARESRP